MKRLTFIAILMTLCIASHANAPKWFNFQGRCDVQDDIVNIEFTVVDADGATVYQQNTEAKTTATGAFTVPINIADLAWASQEYTLSVKINGVELATGVEFGSVPYAVEAQSVGGITDTDIYRLMSDCNMLNKWLTDTQIQMSDNTDEIKLLDTRLDKTQSIIDENSKHIAEFDETANSILTHINELYWKCDENRDILAIHEYTLDDIVERVNNLENASGGNNSVPANVVAEIDSIKNCLSAIETSIVEVQYHTEVAMENSKIAFAMAQDTRNNQDSIMVKFLSLTDKVNNIEVQIDNTLSQTYRLEGITQQLQSKNDYIESTMYDLLEMNQMNMDKIQTLENHVNVLMNENSKMNQQIELLNAVVTMLEERIVELESE